jgi:hypothetical protein
MEFKNEKELKDHMELNFSDYFNFDLIGREVRISKKGDCVDFIGEDEKNIYIIEVKKNSIDKSAIIQTKRYISLYKDIVDKNILGVIVAPKINRNIDMINDNKIIIKLIEPINHLTEIFRKIETTKDALRKFKAYSFSQGKSVQRLLGELMEEWVKKREDGYLQRKEREKIHER